MRFLAWQIRGSQPQTALIFNMEILVSNGVMGIAVPILTGTSGWSAIALHASENGPTKESLTHIQYLWMYTPWSIRQ